MSIQAIESMLGHAGTVFGLSKRAEEAIEALDAIRHAARVLTRPMDYTTDEYVKASALLKALAEEAA